VYGPGDRVEFRSGEVRIVSTIPSAAAVPPVVEKREFWVLMGYAVALGVFGAFAGLALIGVIKFGGRWYTDPHPGWFGGHWWWVAVTAAAGIVVGLLRRLTRLPEEVPGVFADLQAGHVDPALVPGTVAASMVSLIGGASVGPEKVLGAIGGGAGSWISLRRGLGTEDSQVNTLAGVVGTFAGVFSSPVVVVLLIVEVARPGGQRFSKALAASIVAGSVSFGIYFAIAGAVLLGVYQVPPYTFEDWHLLAAIPLGLFAALVTTLSSGFLMLASWLFGRLDVPAIAKSALGGAVFGIVGVALPLTMFSGNDQLHSVLDDAGISLGVLVAVLIAKMLTYAVSQGSGFVGGPLFPALFLGGTAGVIVHQAIPGVPLGLAFTCLLPAVLGTLAAAPFSMVLLAALMTRVGPLQTAPILIAVTVAFLSVQGMRYLLASRRQARTAASADDSAQKLVCRHLANDPAAGCGPARRPRHHGGRLRAGYFRNPGTERSVAISERVAASGGLLRFPVCSPPCMPPRLRGLQTRSCIAARMEPIIVWHRRRVVPTSGACSMIVCIWYRLSGTRYTRSSGRAAGGRRRGSRGRPGSPQKQHRARQHRRHGLEAAITARAGRRREG
jgi:H+/Cl- antiporter ClcA